MSTKTNAAIENLVEATCAPGLCGREQHIFREALRALVRLARSEQMLEIRTNAGKLTDAALGSALPERGKNSRSRGTGRQRSPFEFNRYN